jgi:serine/threonine-protein kinase
MLLLEPPAKGVVRVSDPGPFASLSEALEGRYHIERELGEGGMATVYLAEDLKHERKVALKVLKPELAAVVGSDRFLAEIKTTANLQHPHILPLFDSGEAGSFLFYVMPYVEGESLREHLDRERQLHVEEALGIARAVANALQAAHDHGVVHRDIKPGNILLSRGEALVADFGIALAVGAAGGGRLTETGLSLGTPYYMSPEQATGDQDVGSASDIFALACVLYEMLVGEPPYPGNTAQAVLGKIIQGLPVSATAMRKSVPPNVDAAIRKALEKLPADRFTSAKDFVKALADPGFRYGQVVDPEVRIGPPSRVSVGLVATIAAFAGVVGLTVGRTLAPSADSSMNPARFVIDVPPEIALAPADLSPLAISDDAQHLVFVGESEVGTQLYHRAINALEIVPIDGTEDAMGPFFSPGGRWVGFFAGGKLKKIPIEGGVATELADAALARGASWGANDTIFFTSAPGTGLWAVDANGGPARLLTELDASRGERTHRFPQALSDASSVLFTAREGSHPTFDDARIERFSIDDQTRSVILEGGSHGWLLSTGHLLFARAGALHALVLEAGPSAPVAVIEDVMTDPSTGSADYAISRDGTLVYVSGGPWVAQRQLVSVGPAGSSNLLPTVTGPFRSPRFAPGGNAVAVVTEAANDDIWIYDLEDSSSRRLTFAGGSHIAPLWSPDGSQIVFSSNREGRYNLYVKRAGGSGEAERLTEADLIQLPSSWHPDGSSIAFTQTTPGTGSDVLTVTLDGGVVTPLLENAYNEFGAVFHPTLPWIAYVSDETGTEQVYVDRYPAGGSRQQVSLDGGVDPLWGRASSRLYYRRGEEIMSVLVELEPEFHVSAARLETELPRQGIIVTSVRSYDVASDGQGFLTVAEQEARPPTRIHVVMNFFEELKRLVPN